MNAQESNLKVFLANVGSLYQQTGANQLRWGYLSMVMGSLLCKLTFAALVPVAALTVFFHDKFFSVILTIDISLLFLSILIGFIAYFFLQKTVVRVLGKSHQLSP
ncbi:MAG: hypothetical protein KGQ58_03850 [Proteobacteria bacterium]|nr:hypothetical protein [Pseudomonadota bacterium]